MQVQTCSFIPWHDWLLGLAECSETRQKVSAAQAKQAMECSEKPPPHMHMAAQLPAVAEVSEIHLGLATDPVYQCQSNNKHF